ncbi:MAG: glycosyltransferase family 2 protein [Ignavibacteriales bacterium]|nr:glycosyltransferase family 2 protein [Ignavibacteriales bacterium]
MPLVSIIVVNYDGKEQTIACLQSLAVAKLSVPYEVIVVDNHSSDDSVASLRAMFPSARLLPQQENLGFGKANNLGAASANGEYLFFVNNDTLFTRDIVTPLCNFLSAHPEAGAAAPMLLNADGTFQLSYGKYPSILNELRTIRDTAMLKQIPTDLVPRMVEWVSFAAVMIPRSRFAQLHGFDEAFFMYFEDVDFCHRLHDAGCAAYYCGEHSIIHIGGASWSGKSSSPVKVEYRRSQMLYYRRHRSAAELLALRCYLTAKFVLMLFRIGRARRPAAMEILSLVWNRHARRT